jgi:hypothetical protein
MTMDGCASRSGIGECRVKVATLQMAPYGAKAIRLLAGRGLLLELRLRAFTCNGGRSAGIVDAVTAQWVC